MNYQTRQSDFADITLRLASPEKFLSGQKGRLPSLKQ